MSTQQLKRSQLSDFDYNLRLYRTEDSKEVQALYRNAMVWQSHSPVIPFFKLIATTTAAKVLWFMSMFGIVIGACHNPAVGLIISLTAGGAILIPIGLAFHMTLSLVKQNVKHDLSNVAEHYMLVPNVETYDGDLKTSGPRGFWVVEATHRVTGKKELAGCGGLDMRKRGENMEAELRRVAVSNLHTRRGVAAMIIKAVVSHAKAHQLPSVYLSTSSMQGPAVELYKKHGWIEEERREVRVTYLRAKLHAIFMRLHLKD